MMPGCGKPVRISSLLVPLLTTAVMAAATVSAGREQEPPPLELVHAGHVSGRSAQTATGEERITDLADSVLFRHGEQWVLADRASYRDRQEEIRLWGHVRGWDEIWRVTADEAVYRARDRVLIVHGRVRARNTEDGVVVEADEVTFDRDTGEGLATGSPRLLQPAADSTGYDTELQGEPAARLRFEREAGWAELSGGAAVRRGRMLIRGRWLRSEDDARILAVRDSVQLEKEGVTGAGGFLHWDEEAGLARLLGPDPFLLRRAAREEGSTDSVWTRMTADSLDIQVEGDVLTAILLHGSGEVVTRTLPGPGTMMAGPDSGQVPAVPEHMHLVGRDITITLADEQLNDLTARRAAIYYWRSDLPERRNAMGGMEIYVLFSGGEPSRIRATGNAVTRYYLSTDPVESDLFRAMATTINLTVEDGSFQSADLEAGNAWLYSAEMVRAGGIPMAVHPDSVEVAAGRPAARPARRPPPIE